MRFFYHKNCIVCENKEFEVLLTKENYKYTRCTICGLIFINPTPIFTKEEMNELNAKELFPKVNNISKFDYFCLRIHPEYERQFYALYKYIKKNQSDQVQPITISNENPISLYTPSGREYCFQKKILDVGCGTGYFLFVAKNKGFEPFGVEICEAVANYTKKEVGIKNIFIGELKEANFPNNYFDGIRLVSVLEHLANPTEILKEINRIIKKGGILQIGVPNEDSLFFKTINFYYYIRNKKNQYACSLKFPIHLYGFNKKNLKLLLKKVGFKILHSFSIAPLDRVYAPFKPSQIPKTPIALFKTILIELLDIVGNLFGMGRGIYLYATKIRELQE